MSGLKPCAMDATGLGSARGAPRFSAGFLLLATVLLGTLAGCSHYRLGTDSTPTFHTLYLEPVLNHTLLPQSQALLTTHLREAFARDGRVSLANSPEAADAILTVVIANYHREVAAGREDDTGLARKFNVTLEVSCTLRERRQAKPLFENRLVQAQREIFTDSGQLQAEYQTLPLLADALALKVLQAALDRW